VPIKLSTGPRLGLAGGLARRCRSLQCPRYGPEGVQGLGESWVGVTGMLPCCGPRPGGDVICGAARGSTRVTCLATQRGLGAGRAECNSFAFYTWMKTGSAQVT
jgi:hypothetical protein